MESFLRFLKKELVHYDDDPTRTEARLSIFEYVEVFFNRQRRRSTLGYLGRAEWNYQDRGTAGDSVRHPKGSVREPCAQLLLAGDPAGGYASPSREGNL